jgi:uncharacterized membrane protein YdbT with pleckstrin-like domain
MSYISHTLLDNEKIEYYTGPHWIVFWRAIVSFAMFLAFFLFGTSILPHGHLFGYSVVDFISIALFAYTLIQTALCYITYITSEYGITNQRIIIKVGFIRRDTLEILLKRVESIQVDQSIMGRILNYGAVTIRGTGGSHDPFTNVPNPLQFRKVAQQHIASSQDK